MEMPIADVVDRYTILLIKQEHGLNVTDAELEEYCLVSSGYNFVDLLNINSQMWDLEEQISKTRSLTEIGRLYVELRRLTKRRVEAKNRIAFLCNEPREVKSY